MGKRWFVLSLLLILTLLSFLPTFYDGKTEENTFLQWSEEQEEEPPMLLVRKTIKVSFRHAAAPQVFLLLFLSLLSFLISVRAHVQKLKKHKPSFRIHCPRLEPSSSH